MIEAIKTIGEYALEKEGKNVNNPLNILLEDPESNPKNPSYKHIFLICVEKVDGDYEYKGVDVGEYSKDRLNEYLYRQGSSNGPDITPTSRVTTIESTFRNTKILPWFKSYTEDDFLGRIGKCLRNNKEKIQNDLEAKYEEINKKEKAVLTLKIDGKYIGEYEIFKNILLEESKKGFYLKYGVVSKSEDKICCVCNERKGEVYGFVDTYKFYTVDKPGFVSGGFHQKDAWKNYPVCLTCALKLEEGRKHLKKNLNFNFYGINYHLIPRFVVKEDYVNEKNILDLIEEWKDPKFRKKEIDRLTQDEGEILELISEQQNFLNVNFMFYEAPKGYDGSVFNILLYIEDILPSRLKTLFDVKSEIDTVDIFKEYQIPIFENKKKVGERPLVFNFGILKTFFPYKKDPQTKKFIGHYKYFLELTNKIFTGKSVDYDFLLNFIMQKIRSDFVNNFPTKTSTLEGFMLINYLSKLKQLRYDKEESKMEGNNLKLGKGDEVNQKISSFFREFSEFFDSEAKKAIFLEGVLAQFLLNIQYTERGATPFRSKLKGLKLDEQQVKKLMPEIQNKLEEYGKNYYRSLEKVISEFFVSAGNGWKMSNDEVSFYFVLGMNLSDRFKSKKEDVGGEKNE